MSLSLLGSGGGGGSLPAPWLAGLLAAASRFSSRRSRSACLRALFFLLLLVLFLHVIAPTASADNPLMVFHAETPGQWNLQQGSRFCSSFTLRAFVGERLCTRTQERGGGMHVFTAPANS